MKKLLIVVTISLLLIMDITGQTEINGTLGNFFSINNNDSDNLLNATSLELGVRSLINDNSTLVAALSGKLILPKLAGKEYPFNGNIDKLYFKYAFDKGDVKAGRMGFNDSTGYILNLNLDGALASYDITDALNLNLGIGYGGLTFSHATSFVAHVDEQDSLLGPQRAVWQFRGTYALEQGISIESHSYGQIGLDDTTRDLTTWYVGAGGTIPFNDFILRAYYTFNGGTFPVEYGGEDSKLTMGGHMAYGALYYYPLDLRDKGLQAVLSGLFTSGDASLTTTLPGAVQGREPRDATSLFIPISQRVIGSLISAQPGNIIQIDALIKAAPVKGSFGQKILDVGLGASVFLRPTGGSVQTSGLNTDSQEVYLGTEARLNSNFRPFSDMGINGSINLFIPNRGADKAFGTSRKEMELSGGLFLSVGI